MNASIEKYLKLYNLAQLALWLLAIVFLPFHFLYAFYLICTAQFLSIAEVYHAYKKWNQSPLFLCFVQIAARLFILYLTATVLLETIEKPIPYFITVIYLMLTAWCTAEIIRYTYYLAKFKKKPGNNWITWLRYSAFIICYPVGLACEFYVLYTVFTTNGNFIVKILMLITAIAYIFLFPKLYLHLLKQRKQKLI